MPERPPCLDDHPLVRTAIAAGPPNFEPVFHHPPGRSIVTKDDRGERFINVWETGSVERPSYRRLGCAERSVSRGAMYASRGLQPLAPDVRLPSLYW